MASNTGNDWPPFSSLSRYHWTLAHVVQSSRVGLGPSKESWVLVITFKGLGNSLRGKTLWQIVCLTLIWMVWQERNNRIFEDKGRTEEMVWDLIQFYSSLWASCIEAFKGIPLNVLQLNWIWGFSLFLEFYCWEFSPLFNLCRKDLSLFPWFFSLSLVFFSLLYLFLY